MFWIELTIVLATIFLGVQIGGTFLAVTGGIGTFIITFIPHVTPSGPSTTVILIMIAITCAATTVQTCGGLGYPAKIAEKILRGNPRMITALDPAVVYIFTFICGIGHIVYSLLPVINETAIETGVRPKRPISTSIVSSQQTTIVCPASAATMVILAFMAGATGYDPVNAFTLLLACIPATLVGAVICALVVAKKGKELVDDPELKTRAVARQVEDYTKVEKKERPTIKEVKISVAISLVAMAGIVLLGAVKPLVPTLVDENKLSLTTVTEVFILATAVAMVPITKLGSNKVLNQSVFHTGIFAVVLTFDLCWLVSTFIGDQSSFTTDNMSILTNQYPWIYIIAVSVVGTIITSQSSAIVVIVPVGIAPGLPANIIAVGWVACSSNYFIPASGQCVAAIAFDSAGTTKIGKFVLNHNHMVPGLVYAAMFVAIAPFLGSVIF